MRYKATLHELPTLLNQLLQKVLYTRLWEEQHKKIGRWNKPEVVTCTATFLTKDSLHCLLVSAKYLARETSTLFNLKNLLWEHYFYRGHVQGHAIKKVCQIKDELLCIRYSNTVFLQKETAEIIFFPIFWGKGGNHLNMVSGFPLWSSQYKFTLPNISTVNWIINDEYIF